MFRFLLGLLIVVLFIEAAVWIGMFLLALAVVFLAGVLLWAIGSLLWAALRR
jgi:hypothetical protein